MDPCLQFCSLKKHICRLPSSHKSTPDIRRHTSGRPLSFISLGINRSRSFIFSSSILLSWAPPAFDADSGIGVCQCLSKKCDHDAPNVIRPEHRGCFEHRTGVQQMKDYRANIAYTWNTWLSVHWLLLHSVDWSIVIYTENVLVFIY